MPPLGSLRRVYRASAPILAARRAAEASLAMPFRTRAGFAGARVLSPERPAAALPGSGGPEGKLRGRPPPPHCRAPDLGDGRGLNPSPDEREPAARSITQGVREKLRA